MKKKEFYVYQEDLIRYRVKYEKVTITQLVEVLNAMFSQEDMKRLRTEIITNYLTTNGYLTITDSDKKRPTFKGKLLGIDVGVITDKTGREVEVNLYNEKAQNYILDNLYEMI